MPWTILVATADTQTMRVAQVALERAGYSVLRAGSGREAMAKLAATHPDLLVVSAALPDMAGGDLLRMVRMESETAHLPVVMLTTRAHELRLFLADTELVDRYLTGPFAPDELVIIVEQLLSAREAQKGGKIYDL